jgi:predicted DNA-binding transcriptional regulator YafY
MPTNKNATIRYQALDKCFRDFRHRYYIDDLIERCNEALNYFNGVSGVSRRQIFDDINFMESDVGWSIPLERKKDGKKVYYRYEDSDFSINEQPLTDEEAQLLQTAVLTLSRFHGLPDKEWVDEIISNLEWRFNLNGRTENLIGFEQNAKLKGLNFLSTLIDATSNHHVLNILYRNYKNGGKERTFIIHPYFVKQYNSRWFLFGLEDKTNRIPNIALDRILNVEIIRDIAFIPNTDIDFEHYFDDVVGVTIPPDDVQKEKIVIKFTKKRFPYVASKPIHPSQQTVSEADGIISIEVKPNLELDQQILAFGPDAEVVSPESYRNEIKQKVEENMKKYLGVQNGCTE